MSLLQAFRREGRGRADRNAALLHDQPVETGVESVQVSPFYAMRYRNFRLYFIGQLISVAGTWMQTVAQGWLVWSLTHSAQWLGIISGASAIPYVAFSVWGGKVADRVPRRFTMIWTQVVAMVLAFILAALSFRWGGRPAPVQAWHVAVLSGCLGVVNAFTMPTQQAFVVDIVEDRAALGNAIALNSLRFNLARFLGPILAGAVLASLGEATCFFLNGVSFIAVIISLYMMRLRDSKPVTETTPFLDGLWYIYRTRTVLRVVVMVGLASLFAWSVSTLYPVFATRFHKGSAGYSYIMAVNGVGAAIGGLAAAFFGEGIPRRLLVYYGAIAFNVSLILLSIAPSFLLALAALAVSGFAMIVFGISCNTQVQSEVPDNLRGRVMAVYSLVFAGLMPLGGLEIGFVAQHTSAVVAVRIDAGLCLLGSIALFAWSSIDRASHSGNSGHSQVTR
ncbi:MAG TPA: MFS transporter [Chthonomonadales bacterium]|nr:MFS transporter [Chthonomonadales bacterium]